jgi:uridine phosphorylase
MNEEHYNMLYARAKEVQSNLKTLVQEWEDMGMTREEIEVELAFTLIHDGYRLKHIETQIRELQDERKRYTEDCEEIDQDN